MIELHKYSPEYPMHEELQNDVVNFLFESLEEYGDPKQDINKAIDFAFNKTERAETAGLVIVAFVNNKISGAVVINETGMSKYIPENILVYIATKSNQRGSGIGKKLIQEAINSTHGDIALHVEPDNPAKGLYEKFGFTNKYLEMRFKKQ